MKKIQYSYLPVDRAAAGSLHENKTEKKVELSKTIPPPDDATVARLNAIGREYPFCAWYKPKHNTLL